MESPAVRPKLPHQKETGVSEADLKPLKWKRHYSKTQAWKRANRDRVRELNRLSYERTKILKGRPRMTPEQRRARRNYLNKLHRPQNNAAERKRAKANYQFCLARRMRACLRCALKRHRALKPYDTFRLVGCSLEELARHLERQFLPGMTWENRRLWHVDHKKPIASFNLHDPEQQKRAFHFTNLQPLWAKDNQQKSDKVYL